MPEEVPDPLISFRGISRAFAGRPVLRDVSLDFAARQVTAVVGASGCGKSTLLKLCNGLLRPDAGEISVFGEPIDYQQLPVLRRRMGYAVQGTGLFPHMSARDNIDLGARLAGWSDTVIAERIGELTTLMHLDANLLDRYPHQLSGGQQQRVGLCRAMMLRPDVLLLDEPFAAIDPITRQDIHAQLQEIMHEVPITALLVTHDMREAMELATRIVVLREGEVRVNETAQAIRDSHPGEPPERVLQGILGANDT